MNTPVPMGLSEPTLIRDTRRMVYLAAMESEMACQMVKEIMQVFNPQLLFPNAGQQSGRAGQIEELWQDFTDAYRSLMPEVTELARARLNHSNRLWRSLADERAPAPQSNGPVPGVRHSLGAPVDG
jgi:malate synthase